MKFRFVLLQPDEDPDGHPPKQGDAAYLPLRQSRTLRYERRETNMVRLEPLPNGGWKSTMLTNFTARIVSDIIRDDGEEERRDFGVAAEVGGQRLVFTVSAAAFGRMGWVLPQLGPQAIIYPGQRDHVRAAIQELSGAIPRERVYTHLGWTKKSRDWLYLHATGATGAEGLTPGVKVELPAALQHYQLRWPKEGGARVRAVRASLRILAVAPDPVTLPLLAAVYRAALGKVDFSLFVAGRTGVFKSALAALCQQHFGAAMDAHNLPANFASTGNALEGQAFYTKDALLVVDDFAPTGSAHDRVLQRVAERLFRAAGNHQGRSRMGAGGRLRAPKMPRGLILATGEVVPPGQSIRARLVIVEVGSGDVDRTVLSECQRAGAQGRLMEAMGGFVTWLAGHYEEAQQWRQNRVEEVRRRGAGHGVHARLPSALAELQIGWEIFLRFAREVGAIELAEKQGLEERGARALEGIATLQAKYWAATEAQAELNPQIMPTSHAGRACTAAVLTSEIQYLLGFPRACTGQ